MTTGRIDGGISRKRTRALTDLNAGLEQLGDDYETLELVVRLMARLARVDLCPLCSAVHLD